MSLASAGSPLRVLTVTNMYPTAEDPVFGTFVESQVRSLVEAGVAMTVEFMDGRRSDWNYVRGARRVRRLVQGGGFDLVHAHYGITGLFASFHPLPLVVSFCGDDLLGTPNGRGGVTTKSRVIRGVSLAAARRARGIIVKSDEMRRRLPGRDQARARVIPNGVDLDRFAPGDRAAARQRLGLDPGRRLVLFPHTPKERRKRLDLARAAVDQLGGSAELWIVSGMPPGQMPDCYRAADCMLLTSDWEGSANVVKEALACDLPVVSVDAGDAAHWIAMAPGSRLAARDPAAIADALREVLAGAGRSDGSRVREAVALPVIAHRVLELYRLVLGRARTT